MQLSDVAEFCREIEQANEARILAEQSRVWVPMATHATSLGYKCTRRIYYQRTQPDQAAPINPKLASIFSEGNLHQTDVRTKLAASGYEVVESEVNFYDRKLDISGTIDGKIERPRPGHRHGNRIPVEIKSCTGKPPRSQAEMAAHPGIYGRYYSQLTIYLFLCASRFAMFLFKDKITGIWSLIPFELDYDHAEILLLRAEEVRNAMAYDKAPRRQTDRSECGLCPWRDSVCHPAEAKVDPLLITQDEQLEAQLIERESLEVSRKRYKVLDDLCKDRFKMTRGDRFLCGDFLVRKKKHGKGIRVIAERVDK